MQELPDLKVGQVFTNRDPRAIRIKNPDGIRNQGNTLHAFNEKAWIMMEGQLTIVAIDGDQLLLRYKPPPGKTVGTQAGNGALFLMNRWKFIKMVAPSLKKSWNEYEREYIMHLLDRAGAEEK